MKLPGTIYMGKFAYDLETVDASTINVRARYTRIDKRSVYIQFTGTTKFVIEESEKMSVPEWCAMEVNHS